MLGWTDGCDDGETLGSREGWAVGELDGCAEG